MLVVWPYFIGDKARYGEIEPLLDTSIEEARTGGKIQEALLAMVNSQLAVERQKMIEQCLSLKSDMNS